jgi:hypothetical protein
LAGVDAAAITWPAPKCFASWIASEPTPPAAAFTRTDSPQPSRALFRSTCHAVSPWMSSASACPSVTSSGTSTARRSGGDLDEQLVRSGDRRVELRRNQDLGAAELGDLDRAHMG